MKAIGKFIANTNSENAVGKTNFPPIIGASLEWAITEVSVLRYAIIHNMPIEC